MIVKLYRAKDLKMMALTSSSNPKLEGKYRLVLLSTTGITTAFISRNFTNPWLPLNEAIKNAEKIAAAKGWQEMELTKWTEGTVKPLAK